MCIRAFREMVVALTLAACAPSTAPSAAPTSGAEASSTARASQPQPASSGAPAGSTSDVVVAATAWVTQAKAVEPTLTPVLVEFARAQHGKMMKLEHRLKTVESTARKLRAALAADSALTLQDVRIDDALRYTMNVDDVPPGHYLAAAKDTLAALEARGHQVEYVKNYWPADDNYSGINSVLRDPSGLFWELQFHTSASFAAQLETRDAYEEIRAVDTPLERQRELFDGMTERWNQVPIPGGVLTEGAIHPREQLRERPRP